MSTQLTNSSQITPVLSSHLPPLPPGRVFYRRNRNNVARTSAQEKGKEPMDSFQIPDLSREIPAGNSSQENNLDKTIKTNQEYNQAQFKILESRVFENRPLMTPRNLFSTTPTAPESAPINTSMPTATPNFGSNVPQNTHGQGANDNIAREFQKIKDMISSVPGFYNPIPEVKPASYLINRYGDRIANVEIPKKFQVPNMKPYDGTTDPQEHIALYLEKMETVPIPSNLKKACLCRSFGSTLSGSALKWLQSLPPLSINSFADLTNLFYSQFSRSRTFEKVTDDLYKIIQKPHESLRDFMTRFTKESLNIPKLDMLTAIQALQKGLHKGSKFQEDLIMTPCRNLDEAKAGQQDL
uniref:uncharacterized protein LOC122601339 n=1 Tax=Erigeron canadensis TaxID=72917 RepID=UPI001CB895C9|nr:uncharacterized protein LOC122601339 [Erigeron canadensis]